MRFRFFFLLLAAAIVFVLAERVFSLAAKGELFKPDALRDSFRQVGKTIWLGARLFVVIWIFYLIFLWWVRHRN